MSLNRLLFAMLALPMISAGAQNDHREQFAVMAAVLDSLYHSQGDYPSIVIVADSLYWREGGVSYGGRLLMPHESKIDSSTIADFEARTARSVAMPTSFKYSRLVMHTVREYQELVARGKLIEAARTPRELTDMPFWMAFAEKYPRAWGITYLSQAGFNTSKSEALIFVRHGCGGGCHSSETMLLRKLRSRWKIIERITSSREGMGIGSLRYLGPGAHFIADRKRAQDSTRRAIADSIARDRAPRRIRGTVASRQTGLPIAHAQIFVRTSAFPGQSVRRVVADARGRYVIINPRMGGTMLEVQCPGPAHRAGWTLDAPGTYVFPAMDTVIDMGPPNIAPCWRSPRVHPLSSGELSSSMYLQSPFPSASDMGVYAALMRDAGLADSSILFANTRGWCGILHQCPRIHTAHLERSGFLDSSTMQNFRRVSSDSVPLNPSIMETTGAALLSSGERDYLTQESARANIFGWKDAARDFWSLLMESHPGVKRIISFTRPGFDSLQDQAIVGFRVLTSEDEETETVLLKKTGDSWNVVRRHLENEPISADLTDGSCVPVEPNGEPSREEIASTIGVYDFTLVSSATSGGSTSKRIYFVSGDGKSSRSSFFMPIIVPLTGGRFRLIAGPTYVNSKEIRFDSANRSGNFNASSMSFRIRRVSNGLLFGEWEQYWYGHGIPVDKYGKAIPQPAGHFCAIRRDDQAFRNMK